MTAVEILKNCGWSEEDAKLISVRGFLGEPRFAMCGVLKKCGWSDDEARKIAAGVKKIYHNHATDVANTECTTCLTEVEASDDVTIYEQIAA